MRTSLKVILIMEQKETFRKPVDRKWTRRLKRKTRDCDEGVEWMNEMSMLSE